MTPFAIGTIVEAINDYQYNGISLLTFGKKYKIQDINFVDKYSVVVQADNGLIYQFDPRLFNSIETVQHDNVVHGAFVMQSMDIKQFERNLKQLIEFGEDSFDLISIVHLLKPIVKELESKRNEKYNTLFKF